MKGDPIIKIKDLTPIFVSLSLFAAGCDGENGNGSGQHEGDEQEEISVTIGPSGGSVFSVDGKASASIPSGALSTEVAITVVPSSSSISGNIGAGYDFGPDGTTFLADVTISITYDEAALPQGSAESDLRLAKLLHNQWQVVDGSTNHSTTNQVRGTTRRFSTYSVVLESTIVENEPPQASFLADPMVGFPPLTVQFDASASSDPDGTIETYAWAFGDGQAGSGVAASHTYTIPGSYSASLTIIDNLGGGATASQVITVHPNTVTGMIFSPDGSATDSDVNDPLSAYTPNDNDTQAQTLPNPTLVGGFASFDGTGIPGDVFENSGDVQDWYSASLAQGQTITLYISDHDPNNPCNIDLDLFLLDSSDPTNPIASSWSCNATEVITLDASIPSGDYFIVVQAFDSPILSNYTNYTMTLGQSPNVILKRLRPDSKPSPGIETNDLPLDVDRDFVPGEMIVRFREDPDIPVMHQGPKTRADSVGLIAKRGDPGRAMLLGLGNDSQKRKVFETLGIPLEEGKRDIGERLDNEEKLKKETIEVIKALRLRPDVLMAEPNYRVYPLITPNDTYYFLQWHYPLINLPQAWNITKGTPPNSEVIVAVVDTGVYTAHSDLTGNLLGTGYDFISSVAISNDGDGIDPNPDDPGDGQTPGSSSYHGTHVAGTVAAVSDNGSGVSGVSWGAKIMPVRVLGKGGGTSYDVLQGVRYAAGLSNDSGTVPDKAAEIINLSLGGGAFSQIEQDTYHEIRDAGIIVVAAAGNSGSNVPSYPASYEGVISVSAVDLHKNLTPYSNFGTNIDVAAPGGDTSVDDNGDGYFDGVLSTLVDENQGSKTEAYVFYQGTSMASPHMAGVVALMKSIYFAMTPDELDTVLTSGLITQDLANNGLAIRDDAFGYGLIDALKAVQVAKDLSGSGALPPILSVTPTTLNFGPLQNMLTMTTSNAGEGSLSITDLTPSANWMTISPVSVDPDQLGTYSVAVDRSNLLNAIYNGTITITTDTAGTSIVPVTMQVGGTEIKGDSGFHFILVIDPITLETIAQDTANSVDGIYNYSFTYEEIDPGRYYIVAGTDLDNDGFVCDPGEACGGYPTLGQLLPIEIPGDTTGLNFDTSFGISISSNISSLPNRPLGGYSRILD